jgi:hypothetical protein
MLFLIAFVGAAIIALVLWKAMNTSRGGTPPVVRGPSRGTVRPRASGPDDDPDFLRKLDEKVRRRDDPPTA